jgi:alpha-galactosidase
MGWNSWNRYRATVDDAVIRSTAAAMVSSGMATVGYQYIVIDDTWQASRDASGNIVPNPTRFPDMKALVGYVHALGLRFGLYSDRGIKTCAGYPGSYGYETQDAQTYASWGVDYLKYDNCTASPASPGIQHDYATMASALKATGRPIVYSICAWQFFDWAPTLGQLWRTSLDIEDKWPSLLATIDQSGGDTGRYPSCTCSGGTCSTTAEVSCSENDPAARYPAPGLVSYASPSHWNDPDALQVGNGGMTDTEYRSQFSLWAIMAAPLIAGNDLTTMSQSTQEILTNAEVIAVDQDALGRQGRPISTSISLEVWSKPLAEKGTYAVVLFNRTADAADISLTWDTLGLDSTSAAVRDLWNHADLGTMEGGYTASGVASHGVVMLKVSSQ